MAGVSKSLDEPRQTQQGNSHYCLRDKLLLGGHGSGGGGGGSGGDGDGGKAWAWISEGRAGETVAAAAAGASGRGGERGGERDGEKQTEKARSHHVTRPCAGHYARPPHNAAPISNLPDCDIDSHLLHTTPHPPSPHPNTQISQPPPPVHGYMSIRSHSGCRFVSSDCVRLPANTGSTAATCNGRLPPRTRRP